jgi:hypothetical protein
MPGVRSFCISCSLAFFWDLILNVTMFPALVVLDENRIQWRGAWFWPWWHIQDTWDSHITVSLETKAGFEGYLKGASAKNLADNNNSNTRMSDLTLASLSTEDSRSSRRNEFSHANFLHMKSTRKVMSTRNGS